MLFWATAGLFAVAAIGVIRALYDTRRRRGVERSQSEEALRQQLALLGRFVTALKIEKWNDADFDAAWTWIYNEFDAVRDRSPHTMPPRCVLDGTASLRELMEIDQDIDRQLSDRFQFGGASRELLAYKRHVMAEIERRRERVS